MPIFITEDFVSGSSRPLSTFPPRHGGREARLRLVEAEYAPLAMRS